MTGDAVRSLFTTSAWSPDQEHWPQACWQYKSPGSSPERPHGDDRTCYQAHGDADPELAGESQDTEVAVKGAKCATPKCVCHSGISIILHSRY